jgi:hypothetical protein
MSRKDRDVIRLARKEIAACGLFAVFSQDGRKRNEI